MAGLLDVTAAIWKMGEAISSTAAVAREATKDLDAYAAARDAASEEPRSTTSGKNRVGPDGPTMGAASGSAGSGSGKNAVTPAGLAASLNSLRGRTS